MKNKRIISLVMSVVISAAVLAPCAGSPKPPTPQSMNVMARVSATPKDGRGVGGADDAAERSADPDRKSADWLEPWLGTLNRKHSA